MSTLIKDEIGRINEEVAGWLAWAAAATAIVLIWSYSG